MKHKWDTVAIVGVGLIGGSIGLALRKRRLARRVIGIGRRESSLRKASTRRAIHSGTLDLSRGVADADVIIVCTPVAQAAGHVRAVAKACPPGALITDAASTKAEMVRSLARSLPPAARFVGSHPLAGSERNGPENAQSDLFESRTVIVTPTRRTAKKDLRAVTQFWAAIGSRVVEMSPAAHDRVVAAASHLPHVVAAALSASSPAEAISHVGSGWLDTTRIAAGDAALWTEILLANQGHVLRSLGRFEKVLDKVRRAIETGDELRLRKILEGAKEKRDAVGN